MELKTCPVTGENIVSPKVYEDTLTYTVAVRGRTRALTIDSKDKWPGSLTQVHQFIFRALIFNEEWPIDQDVTITQELLQRIVRSEQYPRADRLNDKLEYFLKKLYRRNPGRFVPATFVLDDYYYAFAVSSQDFNGIIEVARERGLIDAKPAVGWAKGFDVVLTGKGSEMASKLVSLEVTIDRIKSLSPGPKVMFIYRQGDEKWYNRISKEFLQHLDMQWSYVIHDGISQRIKQEIIQRQQDHIVFVYILSKGFRQSPVGSILLDVDNEDPMKSVVNRSFYVFVDDTPLTEFVHLVDNRRQCYDFRQNYNRPQLLMAIQAAWTQVLEVNAVEKEQRGQYEAYYSKLPSVTLSPAMTRWLEKIWDNRLNLPEENRPALNTIVATEFWNDTHFNFSSMPDLLCRGDLPTPYSWWLLAQGDKTYFKLVDKVIFYISEKIKTGRVDPQVGDVRISHELGLDLPKVTYILDFLYAYHGIFDQSKKSGNSRMYRVNHNVLNFFREFRAYILLFLEQNEKKLHDLVKKEERGNEEPERDNEEGPRFSFTPLDHLPNTSIRITRPSNAVPVLDVDHLAEESANIIRDMDDQEGIFGVFGNWGRGKTYLIDRITDTLKEQKTKQYVVVKFDAWKYQDNPASWAFLYETISDRLYASVGYWTRQVKTIYFNWLRKRHPKNYVAPVLLMLGVAITLPLTTMVGWFLGSIISLGVPVLTALLFTFKLNVKAKKFIKEMTTHVSYKEHLGIQNLIEKDLKCLLQAFILDRELNGKGVLLVVDNLDRCNEKKMIDLVDSLRVVLDDPDIKQRIRIITAIDETLLTTALVSRYKGILNLQLKKNSYLDVLSVNRIVPEYLDKVFVSGVKLNRISAEGRGQVMASIIHQDRGGTKDNFSGYYEEMRDAMQWNESGYVFCSPDITFSTANTDDELPTYDGTYSYDGSISYGDMSMGGRTESIEVRAGLEKERGGEGELPQKPKEEKNEFLTPEEEILLFHYAQLNFEFTPRKIRIIYYRYKLARNLLFRSGISRAYWNSREHIEILVYLVMYHSSSVDCYNELVKARTECLGGRDHHVKHFRYDINSKEALLLFSVLETVIIF